MSNDLKVTLGTFPLTPSEPTPEFRQLLYKQADFGAQSALPILPPGHMVCLNEVAAVEA